MKCGLETILGPGGFSARTMVFGSNPADLCTWHGDDGDLEFAQETSISAQSARRWNVRITAQEAAR